MVKAPESKLQEKIRKALKEEFPTSFFYKTHGGPMQKRGIPDIMGCIDGKFVAIEVKVPGKENTLSELQKEALEQISNAGGLAFMSTSVEDTISTVKNWLGVGGEA